MLLPRVRTQEHTHTHTLITVGDTRLGALPYATLVPKAEACRCRGDPTERRGGQGACEPHGWRSGAELLVLPTGTRSSRSLPCGSLGHGEPDLLLGGVLGGVERLGDDAWAGAVDAILAAVLRCVLDVAVEHTAEEGDGDARDVVVELLHVHVLGGEEDVATHEYQAGLGMAHHLEGDGPRLADEAKGGEVDQ